MENKTDQYIESLIDEISKLNSEIEDLKKMTQKAVDILCEADEEREKLQIELKDCTENYNHYVDKCFKLESRISELEKGNEWISVEDAPIPRDGKEYLTKNNLQGGVLNLISYDKINKCFKNKGNYIFEGNAGTHWKHI